MKNTGERLILNDSFESKTIIEHRHRYLMAQELVKGKVVLDAACGTGYGSGMLAEMAEQVYGIDVSAEAVSYAREHYGAKNVQFQEMSVSKLVFSDAYFDVIISFETIEHVNREIQQSFLSEIKRCLKPTGTLIMSTPNDELYREMTRGTYVNEFHVAEFTEEGFRSFLSSAFRNVVFYYQNISEVSSILQEGTHPRVERGVCEDSANHFGRYYVAVCSNADGITFPENHLFIPQIKPYYHRNFLDRKAFMCVDIGGGWEGQYSLAATSNREGYHSFSFTFSLADYQSYQIRALRFDPCETSCKVKIEEISAEGGVCQIAPINAAEKGNMDIFYDPDPMYLITSEDFSKIKAVTISGSLYELSQRESWWYTTNLLGRAEAGKERLTIENTQLQARADSLQHSLTLQQTRSEEHQQSLSAQQAHNNSLQHSLTLQQTRSEELQQSLSAQQAHNNSLQQSLEAVQKQAREYQEKIQQQSSVLQVLEIERERWKGEYELIVHSRSWKLTEPLRMAGRLLRKLLGRGVAPIKISEPSFQSSLKSEAKLSVFDTHLQESAQEGTTMRILLVSYYCPTRAHAGGLRILDLYRYIKKNNPSVHLTLFTHKREEIDWKYDDLDAIFDELVFSETERLSYAKYVSCTGSHQEYDVVDFQFLQAGEELAGYRSIAKRILFTPMELLSKSFFDELQNREEMFLRERFDKFRIALRETACAQKADLSVCVSKSDAAFLGDLIESHKVCALETGLSELEFPELLQSELIRSAQSVKGHRLLYMAYFGSETNVEALKWYLGQVHPLICAAVPDYTIDIVGRGNLSVFTSYRDSHTNFVGEVEFLGESIQHAKLGIAPALFGSGFRGKVNQYAIYSIPCVVSPLSAEGLAYENHRDILVALSPEDFAQHCIKLLTEDEYNVQMGKAARKTCMSHYTWQGKRKEIAAIYGLPVQVDGGANF